MGGSEYCPLRVACLKLIINLGVDGEPFFAV